MVIKDSEGRLVVALSKKIPAPIGATKAFAVGLLFAKEVGVRDAIIEEDSMIVYNTLCKYSPALSSIAAVVQGIQDISGDFRSVGYSHVRRQGNLKPIY